jgi:hypothetical protein
LASQITEHPLVSEVGFPGIKPNVDIGQVPLLIEPAEKAQQELCVLENGFRGWLRRLLVKPINLPLNLPPHNVSIVSESVVNRDVHAFHLVLGRQEFIKVAYDSSVASGGVSGGSGFAV